MIPGTFSETYRQDSVIIRTKTQWAIVILSLLILLTFPLFLSGYWLVVLNLILTTIVAVMGLHIITGLCGQLSLGHAAIVAVGAYTTGILVNEFGFSFWACLPIAGIAAGVIGVIFGAPSLRIKGFYLAMSTLAAQFILLWLIERPLSDITGGSIGMYVAPPTIAGINLGGGGPSFFYLGLFFAVVAILVAKNLQRSRMGRAWIAIRDNDLAASIMGINIFKYKTLAFFIGCFFAGIAGWLWAANMGSLHPTMFSLKESIWFLGMVVVGGMGSTAGVVMGVLGIRLIDMAASYAAASLGMAFPTMRGQIFSALAILVFGGTVTAFLVFEPRGMYHWWEMFKRSYRLHPYSY